MTAPALVGPEEIARLRALLNARKWHDAWMDGEVTAMLDTIEAQASEIAQQKDEISDLTRAVLDGRKEDDRRDAEITRLKAENERLLENERLAEVEVADPVIVTVQDCPKCGEPMAETVTGTGYLHTCQKCGETDSEDMI